MKIVSKPTSLRWADADHAAITMLVEFEGIGILPFSASPNDSEAHGKDLFTRAAAGEFGVVAEFVPPAKTPKQITAEQLRAELSAVKALPKVSALKALTRPQVIAMASNPTQRDELIEVLALAVWTYINTGN